ncbi:MAG TPA: hypothetical protein P5137_16435, partial [Candidatus Brocadiia bacterium]|nr:hypothetical protein [Candidatus Brocadiia bacterium]
MQPKRAVRGLSVLLALSVFAVPAFAQQQDSAALDVSYAPHGYERWTALTAPFGAPAELGLWLDKERYDTLDGAGGGFIYIAPTAASADAKLLLAIHKAQGGKPAGEAIRQTALVPNKGCISFDLNVAGLPPGEYAAIATLPKTGGASATRASDFRMVSVPRPEVQRKRVQITVQNPASPAAYTQPLCTAVALPKGELWNTKNARIVTA